jgi:hypothetical protein
MLLNCENHARRCPRVPGIVCTVVPVSGSRSRTGITIARHREGAPATASTLTPRLRSELGLVLTASGWALFARPTVDGRFGLRANLSTSSGWIPSVSEASASARHDANSGGFRERVKRPDSTGDAGRRACHKGAQQREQSLRGRWSSRRRRPRGACLRAGHTGLVCHHPATLRNCLILEQGRRVDCPLVCQSRVY